MRVLFIQVSAETRTEYEVHKLISEEARRIGIESYFINQSRNLPISTRSPEYLFTSDQTYEHDFGRNMSLKPKPSRTRRALMMITCLPGGLRYTFSKVRQLKPDVLYTSQQQFDMFLGRYVSSRLKIPHVVHIHYPVGDWLGKNTLTRLKEATLCITVSEFVRSGAIQMGIEPKKTHVLPNPINHEGLVKERSYEIHKEFGWTEENIIITSAGRLDPSKGHMLLINAFPMVLSEFPEARLLICGTSSYRDNYENHLKEKLVESSMQKAVVFAGYREDLPKILADSDIFCLPSENEAFGLVFIEAMASGLPIVALNSGSTPEIVKNGETGLLSEPGDVEGLARNILSLMKDAKMYRKMAAAGKDRVNSCYSLNKITEQWLQILLPIVTS